MKHFKSRESIAGEISSIRRLSYSGVVIALFVAVMFFTQSFAFGQYQLRIATSLYALAAIHPFLIIPLGIANFISNTIMGGLGPLDMLGGMITGILTSLACYFMKKIHVILVAIPIIVIPSLLVPIWLSYILQSPYVLLVMSVGAGQIIPGIVGVIILKYIEKLPIKI